jgi:hypothetical protein
MVLPHAGLTKQLRRDEEAVVAGRWISSTAPLGSAASLARIGGVAGGWNIPCLPGSCGPSVVIGASRPPLWQRSQDKPRSPVPPRRQIPVCLPAKRESLRRAPGRRPLPAVAIEAVAGGSLALCLHDRLHDRIHELPELTASTST